MYYPPTQVPWEVFTSPFVSELESIVQLGTWLELAFVVNDLPPFTIPNCLHSPLNEFSRD